MAPYYYAVILLNILVAALLYFAFGKKTFTYRSIITITCISLLTGLLFPTLLGYLNIYSILSIGLLAVGTSTYYLVKTDNLQEKVTGESSPGHSVKEQMIDSEEKNQAETEVENESEVENKSDTENKSGERGPDIDTRPETDMENTMTEISSKSNSVKKDSRKKRKKKKKQKNRTYQSVTVGNQPHCTVDQEKNKTEVPEIELAEAEVQEAELPEPEVQETLLTDEQVEDSSVSIRAQLSGESEDLRESYIMRGFDAKGAGDYHLAVKYFESAIELNPPADLAEMIQFDIYTMLRELGHYSKAKETMNHFMSLYGSELSVFSIQELKSQIRYIEILQDMLNKANTPNLPYSRIPALIKMTAEEKFSMWKSESLY